ncbi:MAG: tripartite tricarboxylate transporter substrate binding protein [Rhizobiales bacterium]|nr:tripartite tricarboxylate transporter substrate binding protein [Hyphomicrobiales bacterium]
MVARRQFITSSLAVLGTAISTHRSFAQASKSTDRPIRLIVPFAAGGGVDVFARLLADKIKQQKGHSVIVENRAGANGALGGNVVKNAEADGQTLLFSAATHVMARHVMKNAPYDPIADFAHIARVGEAPMMLVMSPKLPHRSISEVIADARNRPDKWTFATAALGAPGHLATVAFNQLAGLNVTIVAYRGTAPALTDVAGGHVQLLIDPVLALLPMANENSVVGLAVTSSKRTQLAPSYPTAAESGLPGLEYTSWYGVWGPKGLSADLVASLNETINNAVRQLEKEGRLARLGIDAVAESPAQFGAYAKNYVARNAELLKAAKFAPI